jgi:hypothetical protein
MWCGGGHHHRECPEESTQSIPICGNSKLKDGESPYPTDYRGCIYAKEELQRRKNQSISKKGSSGRTFFYKYTMSERSFASALLSSVKSKQPSENQKEFAGPQKKQVANKASSQSMQKETVNSNAMDDMFVAFTMAQQIMTGL